MPIRFPISTQPHHISAEFAPNLLTFVALGNPLNHRGWKGRKKEKKKPPLKWFLFHPSVLFKRKLYCVSNQPEILSLSSLCGSLITHQVYDSSVSTIVGVVFCFLFYNFQIIPAPAALVKYVISVEKGWGLRRFQGWSVRGVSPSLKTSPCLPASSLRTYLVFCLCVKGIECKVHTSTGQLYVWFMVFLNLSSRRFFWTIKDAFLWSLIYPLYVFMFPEAQRVLCQIF